SSKLYASSNKVRIAAMEVWNHLVTHSSTFFSELTCRSFLWFLPSFLQDLPQSLHNNSSKPKVRPTAWLDGLRGWAALFVFWYHFSMNYHHWTSLGWGYQDNRAILTLPVIRTVIAGPGMVSIFFVVSGYSLTLG